MMKRTVLLFLFFIQISLSFSQNITLGGTVKDSLENPLPYANILAKPYNLNKNLQFSISDHEGYYELNLAKGDTFVISVDYMGYKPVEYQFIALKNTIRELVLEQSTEHLGEVVIEMPVTVKGDTTTYRVDKFVKGNERKLKNVLKRLPGIEVSKNGDVKVQGKKVTNLLVDGKEFFGGNTKLGIENIPMNIVDKVQVLDNYNEVAFLKETSDSDRMAMNILLKEDKKRFVFGDIEAGKGNKNFYKTHANLFYYLPKASINFIGNLNNIGEKVFSIKDYLSFSGSANAVFDTNFDWQAEDFNQFLETRDFERAKQQFGAINITKSITPKIDLRGYAIFSNEDSNSLIKSDNQYFSFLEQNENATNIKNKLGIGRFNLEYTPSSLERWYARTQIKKTDSFKNNSILSLISDNTNTIVNDKDSKSTYVNQNIEWHKLFSKKHTVSSIVNYTFNKRDQTALWNASNPILEGLIPVNNDQQNLLLDQLKETQRQNFDIVLKHFWRKNSNNHIYSTIGNKFLREDFKTDDTQTLDSGIRNDLSDNGFGNDVAFRLNDLFFGVHYKFKTGAFMFKQGAELHNYTWTVNQQNTISKHKWIVLPDFLAKIEFSKSKKIQFNYNLKTSFSNITRFANRFYLQSHNSIYKGNENLENDLYHSARLFYTRFSLYRGLMLVGNINYTKRVRGVGNVVVIDEDNPDPSQKTNQFLTTRMLDNPAENIAFNGTLHKTIKKLKFRFDGDVELSKYLQNINSTNQLNKNNKYSFEIGVETLFDHLPTIDLGFKRSSSNFKSSGETSKFVTNTSFASIDYDFLQGFVFNFEYSRYNYQQKSISQKSTYEIANATLSYKKENSPWSYKIMTQNIFDTRFKRSNSFSQYLISDIRTSILPRIIILAIGYDL